ncbi:hypothetical protein [uncultured Roseibium sp.]|uniref:hypothetical protein n=1 Tax=uncultured Roseibium sp. TaxID=1936171 RepID=UPI0026092B1F|nr:hypothetical protein [uncultured Roseibium sp.]
MERNQRKFELPQKLQVLHQVEENLRTKAIEILKEKENLKRHLAIVEAAMDIADIFRQFDTDDEDLKVLQLMGMRTFNAFGAGLKLALSGYHQNSALILRDVLETVFLVDLFSRDHSLIEEWRFADKKTINKKFSPFQVRVRLDDMDGFTTKKRADLYELFSELAGHPTMKSARMMRPEKNGDAVIGPFMEATALEAVVSEMGKLAIRVGEIVITFFPQDWEAGIYAQADFIGKKRKWIEAFFPDAVKWKTE